MAEPFYDERDLTTEQQNMHQPRDGFNIVSDFHPRDDPTVWYTIGTKESKPKGEAVACTYEVDTRYSYMSSMYLDIVLPEVKVKKEFREGYTVEWKDKVGLKIIEKGELKVGVDSWNTTDSITLMNHYQRMERNFNLEMHREDIGDIPELTTPRESLDEYRLTVKPNWFFNRESPLAFPLKRALEKNKKVEFFFNFDLNPKHLLIVRENGDVVEYDKKYLEQEPVIHTPKAYVEYAQLHSMDKAHDTNCVRVDYRLSHDDIVHLRSDNPDGADKTIAVSIVETLPVKCIFFVAENEREKGKFTHLDKSPVQSVSWEASKGRKFADYPVEHFDRMTRNHFVMSPWEKGYGAIPLICNVDSLDLQPGTSLKGYDVKLKFKLRPDLGTEKFHIHVLLLVTRTDEFK